MSIRLPDPLAALSSVRSSAVKKCDYALMCGHLHLTGSSMPGSVSPIRLFILENRLPFLKKGGCTFPEIRCLTTLAKQFCFSGHLFNGGRCSQSFQRFFYGDGALLCNCVCHGTCGG